MPSPEVHETFYQRLLISQTFSSFSLSFSSLLSSASFSILDLLFIYRLVANHLFFSFYLSCVDDVFSITTHSDESPVRMMRNTLRKNLCEKKKEWRELNLLVWKGRRTLRGLQGETSPPSWATYDTHKSIERKKEGERDLVLPDAYLSTDGDPCISLHDRSIDRLATDR